MGHFPMQNRSQATTMRGRWAGNEIKLWAEKLKSSGVVRKKKSSGTVEGKRKVL